MQSKTFQIETLGKNYTLAQDCCIHNDNVIFKIEKKINVIEYVTIQRK